MLRAERHHADHACESSRECIHASARLIVWRASVEIVGRQSGERTLVAALDRAVRLDSYSRTAFVVALSVELHLPWCVTISLDLN